MRTGTIPWYAVEVLRFIGEPCWNSDGEHELTYRLASILSRWLAKQVPHGTTKRRLKKLLRDAQVMDAQRAGEA